VVLAGDSAGANLAFAVALRTKQASQDWIKGLYYICPYWDGVTQSEKYPSTLELNGYFASVGFLQAVVSNVCKEDEQDEWSQNALLWPIHATEEDLSGMPPTRTIVMQLDMIRDMGLAFHYKLHEADVDCTFSLVSGGVHEQQLFAAHSPQVTDQSIRDLAGFAQYVSK
jgi:acetyl esterase